MLNEQRSTNWARVCETCRSAACTVYCRADSAYLCTGCDSRIHAANLVVSRHQRVRVCEACERAPAAFMCKADSASLCASCDADIHSANPLARRHRRVPILPIPGCSLYGPAATVPPQERIDEDEDEDEAASWLLQNPIKDNMNNNQNINGFSFGGEVVDEYLDLDEYNSSCNDESQLLTDIDQYSDGVDPRKSYGSGNINGGDRVVPVENGETKGYNYLQFGIMEYHETSKPTTPPYAYPVSISHSVSISSMDACVVPESTRSSDVSISISHPRPPKGTIDIFSNNSPPIQMPPQVLTPVDREARVLRYREKKKTRKFEKTIRYASRKAYAETRPRIKGRFAKRTTDHVEVEVDQMFSTALMAGEGGYGIVPSF